MSFLEGIFTPRTALPRAPTADELAERDLGPRHAASARARNPYEPSPDVGLSPGHAADALARVARARGRGGADRWFRDRARHHPYGAHPGAARSGAPRGPFVTPRASAPAPGAFAADPSDPLLAGILSGAGQGLPAFDAAAAKDASAPSPGSVPASAWRGADGVGARHRARYHPVTAGARADAAAAAAATAAGAALPLPRRL